MNYPAPLWTLNLTVVDAQERRRAAQHRELGALGCAVAQCMCFGMTFHTFLCFQELVFFITFVHDLLSDPLCVAQDSEFGSLID